MEVTLTGRAAVLPEYAVDLHYANQAGRASWSLLVHSEQLDRFKQTHEENRLGTYSNAVAR